MKTLRQIFPNASESTLAANPQELPVRAVKRSPGASSARRRGNMNRTESEFAVILVAMKRQGEILRYEFEGITLQWADMRYTPDFVVFEFPSLNVRNGETIEDAINKHGWAEQRFSTGLKLIEVKGGHIWDRDIVRFKGARAHWPEFEFEMHQKTKNGWKRLY